MASTYKLLLKNTTISHNGHDFKFIDAASKVKEEFPSSKITALLNDLPKGTDQYILHTKLVSLFKKWDFNKERSNLKKLTPSSTATISHLTSIDIVLQMLDSFKTLYDVFYTLNVTDEDMKSKLPQIDEFYSKLSSTNNLTTNSNLFRELIHIASNFKHRPLGIYLDIVINYVLTFLVKLLDIKNIEHFSDFVDFIENKKLLNILTPHVFLHVCQFIK